jgi:hypothetical protein
MYLRKNIATSESGFLFNPATGDSYSANPLAAEIIEYLRQGLSPAEIKNRLLEKYEVDALRLDRDWDEFMNQLRAANLLAE